MKNLFAVALGLTLAFGAAVVVAQEKGGDTKNKTEKKAPKKGAKNKTPPESEKSKK